MVDDVRHWEPQSLPDVIISNAVLQWVPGHRELLVRWADRLAPDGWLAFRSRATSISRRTRSCASWRPRPGGARCCGTWS
jgi:trans-aconitate 2-methyltransferase